MPNIFWYICIAVIAVVSSAFSIYKKRDTHKVSTLIVFYLATASSTWIAEFIVLGLFNSYGYRTGIFTDPWAQNLFGHLILNTTLYPTAAIIMVAFSLGYASIPIIAAIFTIIEYCFVKLGIYEQHWWRYYMTFAAVVVFLLVARKWFAKIKQKPSGLTRAITFYFVAMIIIHTPAPILLLLEKQYYRLSFIDNLVGNLYLSSILIIFFYHLLVAFLLVLYTSIFKKWYWRIVPFFFPPVIQAIFLKVGILVMKDEWRLAYTIIIYELAIAVYVLIEKYTLKAV
ncbi:MAG: hypothetical protein Q8930_05895 [Bacillota bacterium]|nr:hypothetical protein [Bacillota bacterium]